MIRIAIDTDRLTDLLTGLAPILMTYSDLVPTTAALTELQHKHPGSQIILIDRGLGDPTGLASVVDVETHADMPSQLPAWFDRKTRQGIRFLTAYSDRSTLPAIDNALRGSGHENHWRWVATLDGTCFIDGMEPLRRPAVVQIVGADKLGIHGDLSLVMNEGWHPAGETAEPIASAELPADSVSLQDRAPGWSFAEIRHGWIADLRGTRTTLEGDDLVSLEARIRQLYPDTIA